MRTRIPLTASAILLLVATLGGCGQGTPQQSAPEAHQPQTEYPLPRPATAPPSDSPIQSELNVYAEAVQTLGEHPEYRDSFAGVETDIPGNRLLVHRRPDGAFDTAVQDVVPDERLWLRDVPHNADELKAGVAVVLGDVDHWATQQITIYIVGSSPGLGCVKVGVEKTHLDRAAVAMPARYLPVRLCFEEGAAPVPLVGSKTKP